MEAEKTNFIQKVTRDFSFQESMNLNEMVVCISALFRVIPDHENQQRQGNRLTGIHLREG